MIAGGSAIISPLGEVLAGPLRGSEGCVHDDVVDRFQILSRRLPRRSDHPRCVPSGQTPER